MTTNLAYGLTGTERTTAKTAMRLLDARPVADPHARLVSAIDALIDRRCADPMAGIEIVTAVEEFIELPDATNNRPPTLLDRYPGGTAEHHHAHARLVVASIRRGYQPGPAPAPDYDPWST